MHTVSTKNEVEQVHNFYGYRCLIDCHRARYIIYDEGGNIRFTGRGIDQYDAQRQAADKCRAYHDAR